MSNVTEMTDLYLDAGPVWQAAYTLATESTLNQHVIIDRGERRIRLDPDDVPIHMWGDATQGLWKLLVAMTYGDLRTLIGRCDPENKAAVAAAITALCGGQL